MLQRRLGSIPLRCIFEVQAKLRVDPAQFDVPSVGSLVLSRCLLQKGNLVQDVLLERGAIPRRL